MYFFPVLMPVLFNLSIESTPESKHKSKTY